MVSEFDSKKSCIHDLTTEYLDKLNLLWTKIFNQDMCSENLNILVDHVNTFYEDLYQESVDKQQWISEQIIKLQEEEQDLNRLLKTDRKFEIATDTPLWDIHIGLNQSLDDLREILSKRKSQIYELLLEQEELCQELGEPPRQLLDDPLPSEEELQDFREHLDNLKAEKVNRQYEISNLRREVKNFLQALEISVSTEEENRLLYDRHIALTSRNVTLLQTMQRDYSRQIEEVRESIDTMKTELEDLWQRLEVSPSTRNKFRKYNDYSQTVYDRVYGELGRCQALKRKNVKRFVDQLREEIVQWWDRTLKSDRERSRFSNFTNDCYTDDLLALHEFELEDLKRFYTNNEQIFNLISERKIMWDRMIALEAKASEPGRYNNRGGQLLKEEKERKSIATKLPKIESQLTELVNQYTEENGKPFCVYGEDILDIIAKDWEKKRETKEKVMTARKQGMTPQPKASASMMRTPMSARNATMKRTVSTTNISSLPPGSASKRKLKADHTLLPNAKRSLMNALSSPNVFLRPVASALRTPFKSPLKKTRIIATTINGKRRSIGRSGNIIKKRRSTSKLPKIAVSEYNSESEGGGEESYDSFQKYFEATPNSRSSVLPGNSNRNGVRNTKKLPTFKENTNLPKPTLYRTPSKGNLIEPSISSKSPGLSRTANSPVPSSSRKLTTKNLPIII